MTERAKYEQWLEDLEAKKESTPTKVFDRVRQDYLARLQSVMDQLKEHTSAMQEHAANLVSQLSELEEAEEDMAETLSESELRAQVGEITQAEWDTTSRKAQRELAKLKENQALIAEDLNQIRQLLGGDEGKAASPDSVPRTAADFNELEFLKSVVGTTPAAPAAVPEPKPEPKAESVAAAPSPPVSPPAEKAAPAPAVPSKPAELAVEKEVSGDLKSTKKGTDTPLKVPVQSDNALGIRTSGVVEQPKTLKCAECGSMNYPSEWYCERCGAELTVV